MNARERCAWAGKLVGVFERFGFEVLDLSIDGSGEKARGEADSEGPKERRVVG